MKRQIDELARGEEAELQVAKLGSLPLDKQLEAANNIADKKVAKIVKKTVKDNYSERQGLKEIKTKEKLNVEADALREDPSST